MIYFSVFLLSFIFEVTNSLNWGETKLFFMSVSPKMLSEILKKLALVHQFSWQHSVVKMATICAFVYVNHQEHKLRYNWWYVEWRIEVIQRIIYKQPLKILTVSSGSKWPKAQFWQQRELKVLFFSVIMTQWKSMGNKKLLGTGLKMACYQNT